MTNQKFKNVLANEFLLEFGSLLSIRISQYLTKYMNGSESKFINDFIICPHIEDYDIGFLKSPANARRHFEENLNIGFGYLEINGIRLDANKNTEYDLALMSEYFHDEITYITLKNKDVEFLEQHVIDLIEALPDDILKAMIKDVQKEISFGTLKNT